ncbi:MAG: MFS transporter [Coprobacillus sp.]
MKKGFILKVSLLSASLIVASAPAINANIPAMAKAFSDIPLSMVEMLTTISSLFLMISVFISGFIAKKIGYKQTIILGLMIVVIAGTVPAFIDNFYIVLISRAALGFGIGLFNSLLVSMINYFYDGEEKSSLFGIQSACEGIGGMMITFIAGQLLKLNWQAPFYAYFIAVPVILLFAKFVPKIDTKDMLLKNQNQKSNDNQSKGSFLPVIGYVGFIFIVAILYMTMGIKVSSLITNEGIGSASDGSSVIMLLSLGSMLGGFTFGRLFKILKDYIFIIGLMMLAFAMVLIGISTNVLMCIIGGFIVGFGFRMIMPYLINKINTSSIQNKTLATSLLLVGFNLGSFLSPYGSIILQKMAWLDNLRGLFYIDALCFVALSIISIIFVMIIKNRNVKGSL